MNRIPFFSKLTTNTNINNWDRHRDYNSGKNPFTCESTQVSPHLHKRVETELIDVAQFGSSIPPTNHSYHHRGYNSPKNPFTQESTHISPLVNKNVELIHIADSCYEMSPAGEYKSRFQEIEGMVRNEIAATNDSIADKEIFLNQIEYLEKNIQRLQNSQDTRTHHLEQNLTSFSYEELLSQHAFIRRDHQTIREHQTKVQALRTQLLQLEKALPELEQKLNKLRYSNSMD